MKILKKSALAVAVVLAACATAEDMQRARDSWNGASYEEVLKAWGAPERSTRTADGRDWYTWVRQGSPSAGSSVGFGVGSSTFGGGGISSMGVGVGMPIGTPPPPEKCERTLVFSGGKVVEQHWNGPPSLCADLKHP
jgi:hypothetical protein